MHNLVYLLLYCLVFSVSAKTTYFRPGNSFCDLNWSTSSCWSNGRPVDGDTVYLTQCAEDFSSHTVTYNADRSLYRLYVGTSSCSYTLSTGSSSLSVTNHAYLRRGAITSTSLIYFSGSVSGQGNFRVDRPRFYTHSSTSVTSGTLTLVSGRIRGHFSVSTTLTLSNTDSMDFSTSFSVSGTLGFSGSNSFHGNLNLATDGSIRINSGSTTFTSNSNINRFRCTSGSSGSLTVESNPLSSITEFRLTPSGGTFTFNFPSFFSFASLDTWISVTSTTINWNAPSGSVNLRTVRLYGSSVLNLYSPQSSFTIRDLILGSSSSCVSPSLLGSPSSMMVSDSFRWRHGTVDFDIDATSIVPEIGSSCTFAFEKQLLTNDITFTGTSLVRFTESSQLIVNNQFLSDPFGGPNVFGYFEAPFSNFPRGTIQLNKVSNLNLPNLDKVSFHAHGECHVVYDSRPFPYTTLDLSGSSSLTLLGTHWDSSKPPSNDFPRANVADSDLIFKSDQEVNIEDFTLDGGSIDGWDPVKVTSSFDFLGGSLGGSSASYRFPLTIPSHVTLLFLTSKAKSFGSTLDLTNHGSIIVQDNHQFTAFAGSIVTNNNLFQHGNLCEGSLCDSLSGHVYSATDSGSLPWSFLDNQGRIIKLDGTDTLHLQMSLSHPIGKELTLTGQADTNSLHLSQGDSFIYGPITTPQETIIFVSQSTCTVYDSAVVSGFNAYFRTGVDGIVDFSGDWNNFNQKFYHDAGSFIFKTIAEYTLTHFYITGGDVLLEQPKTSSSKLEYDEINIDTGSLVIEHVNKPFTTPLFSQSGSSSGFDLLRVDGPVTFTGSFSHSGGNSSINDVSGSVIFSQTPVFQEGKLEFNRISSDISFPSSLTIENDHHLDFDHVSSVVVPEKLTVCGTFILDNLRDSLIVNDILEVNCDDAYVWIDIWLNTLSIANGIFVTGGDSFIYNIGHSIHWPDLECKFPGFLTMDTLNELHVDSKIEVTGGLHVLNFDSFDAPELNTQFNADVLLQNIENHVEVGTFYGAGNAVVRVVNLDAFITHDFQPRGGNYTIRDLSSVFSVPSFSIRSGSIVTLHRFDFEPTLFDIEINRGSLVLNTLQQVHMDSLLMVQYGAIRTGIDYLTVYNGTDMMGGCFCGGTTDSLDPAYLTTSTTKRFNVGVLVTRVNCTIDVGNGIIYGRSNGGIQSMDRTEVIGDVFFSSPYNASHAFLENHGELYFHSASIRRIIDWRVDFKFNSVVEVHDFELSLGRGGGLIDTAIDLSPNCKLAFNSDLTYIQWRTRHIFTPDSSVNCPSCSLDFREDGAWVQVHGLFNVHEQLVQNHGRFELFPLSRFPFNDITLENCELNLFRPQWFKRPSLDPLGDGSTFTTLSVILNPCGRLFSENSRYHLDLPIIDFNGGMLHVFDHDFNLFLPVITIKQGGSLILSNFANPWTSEGINIEYGFVEFETGHDVDLGFINMTLPPSGDVFAKDCYFLLPQHRNTIDYDSWNHSTILGTDLVNSDYFNWYGGTVAVYHLHVLNHLYSEADLQRVLYYTQLSIHDSGVVGGSRDLWLVGPIEINVVTDAVLNFVSDLNVVPMPDTPSESTFNNYGYTHFTESSTNFLFILDFNNYHHYTQDLSTKVVLDGHLVSDGFIHLADQSLLYLHQYEHLFTDNSESHGDGEIKMYEWVWDSSTEWGGVSVNFHGIFNIHPSFEQDFGHWLFYPSAQIEISEFILTDRAHIVVDSSQPLYGSFVFDLMDISTHSFLDIFGLPDDFSFRSLYLKSDEFVKVDTTTEPLTFDVIEIYNGEAMFSTSHTLNFSTLLLAGGMKSGIDDIYVDDFTWLCGEIVDHATVYVVKTGFIGTCVSSPYNSSPSQKRISDTASIVFLPGSVLTIDSENSLSLVDSSSIIVEGEVTLKANLFYSTPGPIADLPFILFNGTLSQTEDSHDRVWNCHVIIETEFEHNMGIINAHRILSVYADFIISTGCSIFFSKADDNYSEFQFFPTSRYFEVLNPSFPDPSEFQPLTSTTNVFIEGVFNTSLLSYSIGTVTFQGPSVYKKKFTHLLGDARLHYNSLDNQVVDIENFHFDESSIVTFTTGFDTVLFPGHGVLDNSAVITGTDNIEIEAADPLSDDIFTWMGGCFDGDFNVNFRKLNSISGAFPKCIKNQVKINSFHQLTFASDTIMNGYDDSSFNVMDSAYLVFANDVLLQCAPTDSGDSSCVCDALINVEEGATLLVNSPTSTVRSCFGIFNRGSFITNAGLFRAFSFLSGNGFFQLSGGNIRWESSTEDSHLDHLSHVDAHNGEVSVDSGANLHTTGLFDALVRVLVIDGHLHFDMDASINSSLKVTVERGSVRFTSILNPLNVTEIRLEEGTAQFNTGRLATVYSLVIIDGNSGGLDEVSIIETFEFRGGSLLANSHHVVTNSAVGLALNFGSSRSMRTGSLLVNEGLFNLEGTITLTSAVITNIANAQFNALGTAFIDGSVSSSFSNYGNVTASGTRFTIASSFEQLHSLYLLDGELFIHGGGFSNGLFSCLSATTISFSDHDFTFDHSPSSLLDGTDFSIVISDSSCTVSISNVFSLHSCTITGPGTLYLLAEAEIISNLKLKIGANVHIFDFVNFPSSIEHLTLLSDGACLFDTGFDIAIHSLVLNGGFIESQTNVLIESEFVWNAGGFTSTVLTSDADVALHTDELKQLLSHTSFLANNDFTVFDNTQLIADSFVTLTVHGAFAVHDGAYFAVENNGDLPVLSLLGSFVIDESSNDLRIDWEFLNSVDFTVPESNTLITNQFITDPHTVVHNFEGSILEVDDSLFFPFLSEFHSEFSYLSLPSPSSVATFLGYVCFKNTTVGTEGTLVFSPLTLMCSEFSLILDGNVRVVLNGTFSLCDFTLTADLELMQNIYITCQFTWIAGTLYGENALVITSGAILAVYYPSNGQLGSDTSIDMFGKSFFSGEVVSPGSGIINNYGRNKFEDSQLKTSSPDATFFNYGESRFLSNNRIEWAFVQDNGGSFKVISGHSELTGFCLLSGDVVVASDLSLDHCQFYNASVSIATTNLLFTNLVVNSTIFSNSQIIAIPTDSVLSFINISEMSTGVAPIDVSGGTLEINVDDFTTNSIHLNQGFFIVMSVNVHLNELKFSGGEFRSSFNIDVDSLSIASSEDKTFKSNSSLSSAFVSQWIDGDVFGESGVELHLMTLEIFNHGSLISNVENFDVSNPELHISDELIIDSESIIFEWDLYINKFIILSGRALFDQGISVCSEVDIDLGAHIDISTNLTIESSISGFGFVELLSPESHLTINGQSSVHYILKDGVFDIQEGSYDLLSLSYYGGSFLFNDGFTTIEFTDVFGDLVLSGLNGDTLHIKDCNSAISLKSSSISYLVVSGVSADCTIDFLSGNVINSINIESINGTVNVHDGSTLVFDHLAVDVGLLVFKPNSLANLDNCLILLSRGTIVFESDALASAPSDLTLDGGDFVVNQDGFYDASSSCPSFDSVVLSKDAVFEFLWNCDLSIALLNLSDTSSLLTETASINYFNFHGGYIKGNISVDSLFTSSDDLKLLMEGSHLLLISSGLIGTDLFFESAVVLEVLSSAYLEVVSDIMSHFSPVASALIGPILLNAGSLTTNGNVSINIEFMSSRELLVSEHAFLYLNSETNIQNSLVVNGNLVVLSDSMITDSEIAGLGDFHVVHSDLQIINPDFSFYGTFHINQSTIEIDGTLTQSNSFDVFIHNLGILNLSTDSIVSFGMVHFEELAIGNFNCLGNTRINIATLFMSSNESYFAGEDEVFISELIFNGGKLGNKVKVLDYFTFQEATFDLHCILLQDSHLTVDCSTVSVFHDHSHLHLLSGSSLVFSSSSSIEFHGETVFSGFGTIENLGSVSLLSDASLNFFVFFENNGPLVTPSCNQLVFRNGATFIEGDLVLDQCDIIIMTLPISLYANTILHTFNNSVIIDSIASPVIVESSDILFSSTDIIGESTETIGLVFSGLYYIDPRSSFDVISLKVEFSLSVLPVEFDYLGLFSSSIVGQVLFNSNSLFSISEVVLAGYIGGSDQVEVSNLFWNAFGFIDDVQVKVLNTNSSVDNNDVRFMNSSSRYFNEGVFLMSFCILGEVDVMFENFGSLVIQDNGHFLSQSFSPSFVNRGNVSYSEVSSNVPYQWEWFFDNYDPAITSFNRDVVLHRSFNGESLIYVHSSLTLESSSSALLTSYSSLYGFDSSLFNLLDSTFSSEGFVCLNSRIIGDGSLLFHSDAKSCFSNSVSLDGASLQLLDIIVPFTFDNVVIQSGQLQINNSICQIFTSFDWKSGHITGTHDSQLISHTETVINTSSLSKFSGSLSLYLHSMTIFSQDAQLVMGSKARFLFHDLVTISSNVNIDKVSDGIEAYALPLLVNVNSTVSKISDGSSSLSVVYIQEIFGNLVIDEGHLIFNGAAKFDGNVTNSDELSFNSPSFCNVSFVNNTELGIIYFNSEFFIYSECVVSSLNYLVLSKQQSHVIVYGYLQVCLPGTIVISAGILDLRSATIQCLDLSYTGGVVLFSPNIDVTDYLRIELIDNEVITLGNDLNIVEVSVGLIKGSGGMLVLEDVTINTLRIEQMTDGVILFDENSFVSNVVFEDLTGGTVEFSSGSVASLNEAVLTDVTVIVSNNSYFIFSNSDVSLYGSTQFTVEEDANVKASCLDLKLFDTSTLSFHTGSVSLPGLSFCNLEMYSQSSLSLNTGITVSGFAIIQSGISSIKGNDQLTLTDFGVYQLHGGSLAVDLMVPEACSLVFDSANDKHLHDLELMCDGTLSVTSSGPISLENTNILNRNVSSFSHNFVINGDGNSFFNNTFELLFLDSTSAGFGVELTNSGLVSFSDVDVLFSTTVTSITSSKFKLSSSTVTVDSAVAAFECGSILWGDGDLLFTGHHGGLKVAGTFDLDGDLIVDSNSFAKFHDDSTIENANLKLIDGTVEFTDNSDTKSLSIKITDGLLVFDETASVDVIAIFEIDGGLVNGRGSSVIHQINDLIVTNNGFIYLNESSSITLSSSKLVLSDDSSFVLDDFASINTSITEILLEDSALFELTNDNCNLELLVLDLTQDSVFNVSCPNTVQITTFNHYDGTRTGNTDIQAENYHWTSGLLSSDSQVSTTFVTNSGIFDDNSSFNTKSREIDNHLLVISGGVDWLTNDLNLLNNARLEVISNGVFSIDVDSNAKVSTNDDNSIFVNNGQVSKNCGFDLTINCLFDNSGEFVVSSGSLYLQHTSRIFNGFLTVNSILNINDEFILEADGLINGNSDILMKTPNSQLKVAGTFDLDGDLVVDSNSFAKFHDDSIIENANLKLIDGSVEFTDNSDTKSLFIKITDGLLVFDETASVDVISIFEIDGGLVNGRGSSVIHQINDLIVTNNGFIHLNESSSITLSSSKLVLSDDSSFVLEDFASINTSITEILLEDSALFELTNDNCNLELLVLDLTQDSVFNVSCPNTVQITTFNHYDGTRTGNTDIQAENYHWTSGLLSSDSQVSTTFVTNSGIFDDNSSFNTKSREIDNHLLIISGGVDWLTNDLNLLNNARLEVNSNGVFSIDVDSNAKVSTNDDNSIFVNNGQVSKNCGFDLTINCLFDNSGEFVVNSGSLNLEHTSRILNGFLTVDSILNVNDQLIVEADGLINGNSDILMKTPNSQLKVAGTFDLDGDLIVDSNSFAKGSSVIHQINDLIVTNNGFIHLNESSSITLSSSKLVLSDDSSFVLEDFASINTSITEILLEDSALFELTNDNCNLELLVLDLTQDSVFNVSCPNTVQITTFNHYDGTRTGNTDIQAENYHWTSGLLSSDSQVSTTFVTNSGIFDDNSSFNTKSREIDNHLLVISGGVDWLTNDLNLLNNARLEVNSNGVFSIDVDSNAKVSTNDDNSIFVNNGQVFKNCGFDLTINCLFDNSGEFVVNSGSLNLEHTSRILNGFLTVDSILNVNDQLIVEADGLINGNSDILMKTPNSQLKVAGTFDLDGDLIVDSNSFAKFHDDSTIENANLKLIDGSVEFTDNSDTKSLSIKITDGLLVFDETANVDVISIFEIDGGLVNGRGSSVIHQINDLIVTNNGFIPLK
ncbi:hypothetical protein P9112_003155 [Eukaryota sp. TZLM1-RC]